MRQSTPTLYGLMAEFEHVEELVAAAASAHEAGFRRVEAYSPFPIEGLAQVLGHPRTRLPYITLLGGVLGVITACTMMYFSMVIHYPLDIGGRPLFSWPAYVPIMFELAVLGASLFSLLGMLALNGLPQPYHPVFNVPEFKEASQSKFFLCIEARDPAFEISQTRRFLESVGAHQVFEVEP